MKFGYVCADEVQDADSKVTVLAMTHHPFRILYRRPTENHPSRKTWTQKITHNSIMDAAPLQKLPAELRNRIYELALYCPRGIVLDPDRYRPAFWENGKLLYRNDYDDPASTHFTLALPATCRQLRADTHMMFYAINKFTISTKCSTRIHSFGFGPPGSNLKLSNLKKWLAVIGAVALSHLTHVCIDLGEYSVVVTPAAHELTGESFIWPLVFDTFPGLGLPRASLWASLWARFGPAESGPFEGPKGMQHMFPLGDKEKAYRMIGRQMQRVKTELTGAEKGKGDESESADEDMENDGWMAEDKDARQYSHGVIEAVLSLDDWQERLCDAVCEGEVLLSEAGHAFAVGGEDSDGYGEDNDDYDEFSDGYEDSDGSGEA